MSRIRRAAAATGFAAAYITLTTSAVFYSPGGTWPRTWPKALEPFRERAVTYDYSGAISEKIHEIPFDNREEFEELWPTIRDLATDGATITFIDGPAGFFGQDETIKAGVRIYQGQTKLSTTKKRTDGKPGRETFELERPWPKRFFTKDGRPYPHAVFDESNRRWEPRNVPEKWIEGYRITTEITLVVDDNIVDLSRIELPENAYIHDRRKPAIGQTSTTTTKESNPDD